MSTDQVWYRSLYWRIGVGLVAFLALMLTAQAGLFVWTTDRIAGSMPATSPRRLAVLVGLVPLEPTGTRGRCYFARAVQDLILAIDQTSGHRSVKD